MYPEKNEKRILLIIGSVMAAAELIKQLLLTFTAEGMQYQWWYFPWQLCSIPMYVCIAAGAVKSGQVYSACLAFLSDFGLLAGICAFLDTSGFVYELPVLTVYSYIWHIALICIGIYAWFLRKRQPQQCGVFAGGVIIYFIGCAVAEIINILAFDSGHRLINMFYISPRYIMSQIYIRDMLPILGNTGCIILYILITVLGALIIEFAGRLIIKKLCH